MKTTRLNAYLTVYLSLVFTIVLSLVLALVEGAAIGALRAQSELVADLGMDSAFAEYNREILNQYELFFVDTSYGDEYGGVGELREHISEYMEYNISSDKGLSIPGDTYLKLQNPHLEIETVSYATDENCDVWKAQAIAYMESVYGVDLVSSVIHNVNIVKENKLSERNIKEETTNQKNEFEEALSKKEIVEYSSESDEGYSYKKLKDVLDHLTGEGILSIVMSDGREISDKYIDQKQYLSHRVGSGKLNKGAGVHNKESVPSGILDELLYNEYLMKMYGKYDDEKDKGRLAYQIEYVLFGYDSDVSNLRACAERLFMLRSASNYIYLSNDSSKKNEVMVISEIICTLLMVPELAGALTNIILGIWAMAEAVSDVRGLFSGGKVPLMKSSSDWNLSLTSLFTTDIFKKDTKSEGLGYEDYLRILLALMDKEDKAIRSLDVVEMDIREAENSESFRIDRCIDYMKVNFGFCDSNGHEFVFSSQMCFD